jgi:hypothetical protein
MREINNEENGEAIKKTRKILIDKIEGILGHRGRLISGSKGQYRWDNEDHLIAFNANLCVAGLGKIWHGDLDVTVEEDKLRKAAKAVGMDLYLLHESDARFENEESPKLENAVAIFKADGSECSLSGYNSDYYERRDGRIVSKPEELPDEAEEAKRKLERKRENNEKKFPRKFDIKKALEDADKAAKARLSSGKSETPLEAFWMSLLSEAEVADERRKFGKDAKLHTGRFYLGSKDYDRLKEANKKWIKRKLRGMLTEYGLEKELMWLFFELGPMHFEEGTEPDGMEEGVALAQEIIFE